MRLLQVWCRVAGSVLVRTCLRVLRNAHIVILVLACAILFTPGLLIRVRFRDVMWCVVMW
jgi:hypothetical protein